MMAWLGTALKSSQPNRSASCRSDRTMGRMTGPPAVSCAVGAGDVTLPWYGVAMVAVSLDERPLSAPVQGHARAVSLETITIWPDAKTGNRSWPCRELSFERTPN